MGDKAFYEINISAIPSSIEKRKVDESTTSETELLEQEIPTIRCGIWTLAITLTISLALSFLVWQTDIFPRAVSTHLVIKNGTKLYDVWSVEPVTTTLNIYLFNYTNIEHFESGADQKIKLQEVGPYAYTVTTEKVNIQFHSNGTVSYQDRKVYKFNPDSSKGSPDDILIAPNIPYMSALNEVRDSYQVTRWMLSKALAQLEATPFIKVKAKELIWGYNDKLFSIATQVMKDMDVPFKKFGLFAGKNGTLPDVITVYTGESDIKKKGLISRFNGELYLDHWSSYECNRLDSYPGSAIPPFLGSETIYLYTKDACRRVPLTYRYARMVHGVRAQHYELAEDFFSNQGENECYCAESCLPAGVLNVSACAFGAPIITSNPHFLNGENTLFEMFEGLNPDGELHKTYADIEPNLGLIVDGTSTLQMNVMVRNLKGMSINSVYHDQLILPVTWVKLSLDELPTSLTWELRSIVALFSITTIIIYYGPLNVAAICILILIYRQCKKERSSRCAVHQS